LSGTSLPEVKKNRWTVISMKDDWKTIFTFEQYIQFTGCAAKRIGPKSNMRLLGNSVIVRVR
jgi:hypothetical protein